MSASEAQIKAAQLKQELMDLYHRVFTTEDGRRVLENMRWRAFYSKSTFPMDFNMYVVASREGQRNFVMETEAFVKQGAEGTPRLQSQAVSATAEERPQ